MLLLDLNISKDTALNKKTYMHWINACLSCFPTPAGALEMCIFKKAKGRFHMHFVMQSWEKRLEQN